jgi:hypothetical protein
MADKYRMRFQLLTLVDITRTNARRGDDPYLQKQQQNYLTALQTISLRANPIINSAPACEEKSVEGLGFGSEYTGKQRVWRLNFGFESEEQHNLEYLLNDFNYVPIINNVDETIQFVNAAFITTSAKHTNIVFLKPKDFD